MGSSVAVLRFGLFCSGMSYVCVAEANEIGQTCVAAPLSIISSSLLRFVIMLVSGAPTELLQLRGTVIAAICTAGVASSCEGAGNARCCGCFTDYFVFDLLSTNGCHRWFIGHTIDRLHHCNLHRRPPESCKLHLCCPLPCGLDDHICSSLLCILFLCLLSFLVVFLFLVHNCCILCAVLVVFGAFSFALSCVAIALLSISCSFVSFLSFGLSFLSFTFVLALTFSCLMAPMSIGAAPPV